MGSTPGPPGQVGFQRANNQDSILKTFQTSVEFGSFHKALYDEVWREINFKESLKLLLPVEI